MKHVAGAAAVLALLGCASGGPVSADKLDRVPLGDWGGEHVRLTVSDASAAIEFDCAHGTLDAPLKVDDGGRFEVPGSFVRRAGPWCPAVKTDRMCVMQGRPTAAAWTSRSSVPTGSASGRFA